MNENDLIRFLTDFTPLEKEFRRAWQEGRSLSTDDCAQILNRLTTKSPDPTDDFFSLPEGSHSLIPAEKIAAPVLSDQTYFPDGEKVCVNKHQRYSPAFVHSNNFIELTYMLSGSCEIEIIHVSGHKESLTLHSGQICVFPPNMKHSVTANQDDCLIINILVRTSVMKQNISSIVVEDHALYDFFLYTLYDNKKNSYLLFSTGEDQSIRSLVLEMFTEFYSHKLYSQNALIQMLGLFFTYLQRDFANNLLFSSNTSAGTLYMPQILHYIRNNYATATVENIAKHFSISTSWLFHIFHENFHCTVSEVIQQTRIEHACNLLSTTSLPVQKVAEAVGYTYVT